MGCVGNTEASRKRANDLAEKIGSNHMSCDFDEIYNELYVWMKEHFDFFPQYMSNGGTKGEDDLLGGMKSRCRMILSYLIAQLLPTVNKNKGYLLVLGSTNVDESLLGYYTKYDCTSCDLSPIGALNKKYIQNILLWFAENLKWQEIADICNTPASNELRPLVDGLPQDDEIDLELTYEQVEVISKFRNDRLCGPFSLFDGLSEWWPEMDLNFLYHIIKKFFKQYADNRHKAQVMTPQLFMSYHSCDPARFDKRPVLYHDFKHQFAKIDKLKESIELANMTKIHGIIFF